MRDFDDEDDLEAAETYWKSLFPGEKEDQSMVDTCMSAAVAFTAGNGRRLIDR